MAARASPPWHRHGGRRPALPGRRFNLPPPRGLPGPSLELLAAKCPQLSRAGAGAGRRRGARAQAVLPGLTAPLLPAAGSAGSATPPPSCPLPASGALPGTAPLGMEVWIGVHASLAGLSVPRDPRTTRASPSGEADIHPAVLVLPARDTGHTRPEPSADNYSRDPAGRTWRGRCPRAAAPQAPRGRGRSPGLRRMAVHGGWQNSRGWGDKAPQRKASYELLI